MSDFPHTFHTFNRIKKAERIIDFIDESELFAGQTNLETLCNLGPGIWDMIGSSMNEKDTPSDVTIGIVLGIIHGRSFVPEDA